MAKKWKVGDLAPDGVKVWASCTAKDSRGVPYLVVGECEYGAVYYCQTHEKEFVDVSGCDPCWEEYNRKRQAEYEAAEMDYDDEDYKNRLKF